MCTYCNFNLYDTVVLCKVRDTTSSQGDTHMPKCTTHICITILVIDPMMCYADVIISYKLPSQLNS